MNNTIVLLFARIFEKGIMFLFFILLVRTFGKGELGEFSYYYSIIAIIFIFIDVGGELYQVKEFSKKENLQIFNTIFVLKTVIYLFFLSLMVLFNSNIYIIILFSSYYLYSIILIFRSSLYNHQNYILDAKYVIMEKSIFLIIILFNLMTLQELLVVYLAFLLSRSIYLLVLFNKFYKLKYVINFKKLFNPEFAKQYLFNSWSYILNSLLVVVFVQIDIIMLKHMGVSFEDIGLYSVAIRMYVIPIIFSDVLFSQYYPKVAKYIHNNENALLKKLILRVQHINIFFSVYFTIFTVLFANEIVYYGFGEAFSESSKMLILLSIIVVFRFSMNTYTALLSSSNLNHIRLYTSIVCVVLNIGLNYLLIPKYGVYGAIFATIVTEFAFVLLYKISSFKIIFTNYITIKEVLALSISLTIIYLAVLYEVSLINRVIIFSLLLLSLIINFKTIKHQLNFKEL